MPQSAKSRFENFFEYQKRLARFAVLPFFRIHGIDLNGKSVVDVGCGEGGIVAALAEVYPQASFTGLDAVEKHLDKARVRNIAGVRFQTYDVLDEPLADQFDIVICRDVLEYAVDLPRAIGNLKKLCRSGGKIFIAFPPYYSALGGHQHTLRKSFVRFLPYAHLLPDAFFNQILNKQRPEHEGYDSFIEGYLEDFRKVRKTKISIRRFREICQALDLPILAEEIYFIRPSIAMRYLLPVIKNRLFGRIPVLREFTSSGALYFLGKK